MSWPSLSASWILRAADVDAGAEVASRHFLEGQEPVPLLAVIDERGFEAGLDPGDDAL